ncbi:DUF6247 family protein [Nonomuraea typhae]|uniref:DUF6247 family protein n=1 Tax=Nonomuraea typhae TaxID=2603600 RepID=UPI001FE9BD47|nr:DUF6247 family protein [Nonomuraea typhae]
MPDKTLRATRSALSVVQDREGFDEGLRLALAEVRVSLDLGRLNEFIHTWWLVACDSMKDPQGRRELHERAKAAQDLAARGEPLPRGTRSWRELLAERGVSTDVDHIPRVGAVA